MFWSVQPVWLNVPFDSGPRDHGLESRSSQLIFSLRNWSALLNGPFWCCANFGINSYTGCEALRLHVLLWLYDIRQFIGNSQCTVLYYVVKWSYHSICPQSARYISLAVNFITGTFTSSTTRRLTFNSAMMHHVMWFAGPHGLVVSYGRSAIEFHWLS